MIIIIIIIIIIISSSSSSSTNMIILMSLAFRRIRVDDGQVTETGGKHDVGLAEGGQQVLPQPVLCAAVAPALHHGCVDALQRRRG